MSQSKKYVSKIASKYEELQDSSSIIYWMYQNEWNCNQNWWNDWNSLVQIKINIL